MRGAEGELRHRRCVGGVSYIHMRMTVEDQPDQARVGRLKPRTAHPHPHPSTPHNKTGYAVVVISYDLAVKFATSKRIIPGQFKVRARVSARVCG